MLIRNQVLRNRLFCISNSGGFQDRWLSGAGVAFGEDEDGVGVAFSGRFGVGERPGPVSA